VITYQGVKLDPAFGTIANDSAPPGARVTIGGREAGTTPYRNERLASGRHLVSVEQDLYRPVRNEVVEVGDGEVTSKSYVLEAEFGTVAVDSEPQGARVLVSGKEMDRTPAELRLSPGEYEVVLDLQGYRSRSYRVTVAREKRVEIPGGQAVLERKVFSLMVSAEPPEPGTSIWLDGMATGKTAPEMLSSISEGTHTVELKTDNKIGRVTVDGIDNEDKTIIVKLKDHVTHKARKVTTYETAVHWRDRGTDYYHGIYGLAYYGVGSAYGIRNQKLLQKTAETRAKSEIKKLLKKRGVKITRSIKSSIRIRESHKDSTGSEWYSLAVLLANDAGEEQ